MSEAACFTGVASAASVVVSDGDGNSFGDAQGFRIDFDSTAIPVTSTPAAITTGSSN